MRYVDIYELEPPIGVQNVKDTRARSNRKGEMSTPKSFICLETVWVIRLHDTVYVRDVSNVPLTLCLLCMRMQKKEAIFKNCLTR